MPQVSFGDEGLVTPVNISPEKHRKSGNNLPSTEAQTHVHFSRSVSQQNIQSRIRANPDQYVESEAGGLRAFDCNSAQKPSSLKRQDSSQRSISNSRQSSQQKTKSSVRHASQLSHMVTHDYAEKELLKAEKTDFYVFGSSLNKLIREFVHQRSLTRKFVD